ncbi:helix-turn-helix transcriptional regulator [Actinacidiphila glaucinigra]|uniref:helix-turn-helix transcriptional regulator n=1 Tax=Actinacidiphila glaucinigra TaxID=235986 RepID=UPI003D8A43FF
MFGEIPPECMEPERFSPCICFIFFEEKLVTALAIAVLASDPVTRDGAMAYLQASGQVKVLPPDLHGEADVVLIFATEVTEETLSWMQRAMNDVVNPEMRVILVANDISERHLIRAVNYGLVGFLVRSHVTMAKVLGAAVCTQAGRAELPSVLVRSLIDQIKRVQNEALEPHGLGPSGFASREIDVLRLIADGLDTTEVAEKLNYSERTIKNILSGLMARMDLRNRPHAVAHAMRCGVL